MTWSGINFCLFSNPHFPQLQNHSFDLQNHKMSQSHTYFRPCFMAPKLTIEMTIVSGLDSMQGFVLLFIQKQRIMVSSKSLT